MSYNLITEVFRKNPSLENIDKYHLYEFEELLYKSKTRFDIDNDGNFCLIYNYNGYDVVKTVFPIKENENFFVLRYLYDGGTEVRVCHFNKVGNKLYLVDNLKNVGSDFNTPEMNYSINNEDIHLFKPEMIKISDLPENERTKIYINANEFNKIMFFDEVIGIDIFNNFRLLLKRKDEEEQNVNYLSTHVDNIYYENFQVLQPYILSNVFVFIDQIKSLIFKVRGFNYLIDETPIDKYIEHKKAVAAAKNKAERESLLEYKEKTEKELADAERNNDEYEQPKYQKIMNKLFLIILAIFIISVIIIMIKK